MLSLLGPEQGGPDGAAPDAEAHAKATAGASAGSSRPDPRRLRRRALAQGLPLIVAGVALAGYAYGQLIAGFMISRRLLALSAGGMVVSLLLIGLGYRILAVAQARLEPTSAAPDGPA